jgi:small redox-active disulfide protein 2
MKEVKILGTGCPKCVDLEQKTRSAVAALNIEAQISKVEDIVKIMEYGIMRTPGLVVDNKVLVSGRVPSVEEIKQLLSEN